MIKAVVELAEELLKRIASIERSVVFSGHEMDGLRLEPAGDVPELRHTVAPRVLVFRDVRQVPGEDHEVRLLFKTVDRCNGLLECSLRVGIDRRPVKAPVRVRELDEVELTSRRFAAITCAAAERFYTQPRSEHYTAKSRQLHEISSVHLFLLENSLRSTTSTGLAS